MFKLEDNPIDLFDIWYKEALRECLNPSAMTIATVGEDGRPSARIVLLKHYSKAGFVFFTNYKSRKGKEISQNPYVALVLYWPELARQVRIEGEAKILDKFASDKYHASRPKLSQAASFCSKQSEILENEEEFYRNIDKVMTEFSDTSIPRPNFWGGIIVIPNKIEFWQDQQHRTNLRAEYVIQNYNSWVIRRLYP